MGSLRAWVFGAALLAISALAPALSAAPAAKGEVSLPAQVRALAENILGNGLIRGITVTEGGATVLLRWEAATYKPEQKREETREQLFGEAELVTGSIMGGLRGVSRIRFTMTRKDGQMLATGSNTRGPGVTLTFAPILGGGTVTSGASKATSKGSDTGGTPAAKD